METFNSWYSHLWDIRDKRVDGWFLMDSPVPTIMLSMIYVTLATLIGPQLMKHREPFNLKVFIQFYNIISVILSIYVVYETGIAGWFGRYNYLCQDVEMDTDSMGMRMAKVVWIYYLSKFFEFFDTLFFILRKKFGHVSILHVTHHGIMPIFSYAVTRWLPGGQETFGGFINSIIHAIMYSYYFLAALGPQMQPYLWWKKYLTSLQILQFVILFVKSNVVIWGLVPGCTYPWQFSVISASLMILMMYLFTQFFIQEYSNKKKDRATNMKKSN